MASSIKEIVKINFDVLEQMISVIDTSSSELYKQGSQISDFGVGRHIRHILDYYFAVLNGHEGGLINYNHRNRDSLVEHDKSIAKKAVNEILNWLHTLEGDKSLTIMSEVSLRDKENITIESNLQRELYYLMEHAVHHLAYISLMMKANGISVANDIGLAPATKSYQRIAK